MRVQYNGLSYNGFQKQPNKNTIQDNLEMALKTILKEDVLTTGSGRTDAKVSAFNQPVHFETEKKIDFKKFLHSMNGILPKDIRVLDIKISPIHARFDAKNKTYVYKMYTSNIELPLQCDALHLNPNLNFKAMKKFLHLIVGTHDFKGFQASGSETETTIRTIYKANLKKENNYLNFYIKGNGFLYKMVRNIVGTMLKVGEGKLNLKELKNTLFTTYKCKFTAPPENLYLYNVEY